MSKYIIEIAEEYEKYFKGVLICGTADGKFAVDVIAREDLEELNSDYINEHYGSLQDEAYQRGLDDAWEAAQRVVCRTEAGGMTLDTLQKVFGVISPVIIMQSNTAQEAIDKIKAYDDKHFDRIEVGDEVVFETEGAEPFVILHKYYDDAGHPSGYRYFVYAQNGEVLIFNEGDGPKKTGRHFQETNKLLEAMRTHD